MWFTFGLAPFKQKNPWEPFLEEWLDLHFNSKTLSPNDHEKDPLLNRKCFAQGPKFGFHVWIWAGTFQAKKSLGNNFLEKWLDLHFKGAALQKTDSLTVLITYSFAVCVNILQYHTVFTILLSTDTSPSTPIK